VLGWHEGSVNGRVGGSTCSPKASNSHLNSCERSRAAPQDQATDINDSNHCDRNYARPRESVADARAYIKRVPVVRDGKLVGIVTRTDLVRALARKLSEMETPPPRRTSLDEALRQGREEAIADVRTARPRR
jgi:CBS-domain-containing membrane protein